MSGFEFQVQGQRLHEMQQELRALEDSIRERAIRAGLVAFAAPVKRDAKVLAPTDRGDLAQAIGHRNINKRQRSRLGMTVGEVGILVGANRRINGRWQGRKGLWQEGGTEHMEANPFLAPALQKNQGGGTSRFYQGLSRYLDRQRKQGKIA
ncbi:MULTISPECIES: HK97-gp10 family putative phage morphogenesis protein [unclassified Halomonas]|uniref:HK97-gp10 family putative phage morphogenesis protein n=1 Tax=unclassified Halomonas TaxID=2609666 RepID=UPI0020A15EC6|nr:MULTISPECIES: HK97-gp10 family putative phage morphogenesis protein [unclassified Halomonas]MCP1314388.1 HK97 gp10 family phage protein [Halomonas sp. 707D7]MCP1326057.1 HK97 gp10 family phage protein [Halomonas sp. 707D4]